MLPFASCLVELLSFQITYCTSPAGFLSCVVKNSGLGFGMPAGAQVSGSCSACRRVFSRKSNSMGRRISELEEPLRQQLFSVKGTLGDFVCDECLLELQPLPRTDTLWAAERPDRVKLCASNGWACAKQLENETVRFCHKAGTPRGYTDPLRKLPDCVSAYKRRQMGLVATPPTHRPFSHKAFVHS